jgi:hypothetical protein
VKNLLPFSSKLGLRVCSTILRVCFIQNFYVKDTLEGTATDSHISPQIQLNSVPKMAVPSKFICSQLSICKKYLTLKCQKNFKEYG